MEVEWCVGWMVKWLVGMLLRRSFWYNSDVVDVDGVDGSGCGRLDIEDVVVVAGVVAEVFVVGEGSPKYLTLEQRFLRASFGLDLVVIFSVGFDFTSESW